jgi:integrase
MAKLPGLFKRDGIYQLRVIVPKHLCPLYSPKTKLIQSLGTTDRREAAIRGSLHRAKVLGHFAQNGSPQDLPKLEHCQFGVAMAAVANTPRLSEVFERWRLSKARSVDSVNACKRALALYNGHTGDPQLSALTREQGDSFRTWLQQPEHGTTLKTARDHLTWVKSLLKYASLDLELVDRNPWEGLDLAFSTTFKRRPWTQGELKTFFGQRLFTHGELPKSKKAGGLAAYWIPLIGIYTGARVSEIAQLQLVNIEIVDGLDLFSITDEGDDQRVKTMAGVRKVPIHRELIRLGFLDYVQALRQQKHTYLWPRLSVRATKPGDYFGRWFGEARKKLGFGRYPDFHCLRHTVRSRLAESEIAEPVIDSLLGHEVKGSTGTKIYTHRSLRVLQQAVETVHYPSLKITKIF